MADNIYYSFLAMVYLLIAIFWGIYGRADLPVWSALTAVVCGINVLLLAVPALKRKKAMEHHDCSFAPPTTVGKQEKGSEPK